MANISQHVLDTGAATIQTKLAYTASASGVVVAGLTINEVVGVMVGLSSILFAAFTAWSNHRKNKIHIELLKKQLNDNARG